MDNLIDLIVANWKDFMLFLTILGIFIYVLIFFSTTSLHHRMERKERNIPKRLEELSGALRNMGVGLSTENKDLKGLEKDKVIEEAKKISQLWKSRREQLQMGYWEKMEARADELEKLQENKKHLEELIKRTKVKYHKRELDEESFREIVKDYQKQLMEINVKIWELEKNLG